MNYILLSLSLSMFTVDHALTSQIHYLHIVIWLRYFVGGALICICMSSANEWCMIECESLLADKHLYTLRNVLGQEL